MAGLGWDLADHRQMRKNDLPHAFGGVPIGGQSLDDIFHMLDHDMDPGRRI